MAVGALAAAGTLVAKVIGGGIKAAKTAKALKAAKKAADIAKQAKLGKTAEGSPPKGMLSNLMDKGKGLVKGLDAPTKAAGVTGLTQVIAARQKDKSNPLPAHEDPEMRSSLNAAKRRQRAFQTGTATASDRNARSRRTMSGMREALKLGGGGRKAMMQMQQIENQAAEVDKKSALQGEGFFSGVAEKRLDDVSQRDLDLSMQAHDESQAKGAVQKTAGNSNLGLLFGKGMPLGNVPASPTDPRKKKKTALQIAMERRNKAASKNP